MGKIVVAAGRNDILYSIVEALGWPRDTDLAEIPAIVSIFKRNDERGDFDGALEQAAALCVELGLAKYKHKPAVVAENIKEEVTV
jgi:hypothetical protein